MNAEKREELIQEHEEALIRVFIKKERVNGIELN
tara:strand:+ start:459 stop:560 length:102 start_codon:yes stop_codon:yes gene_type:complete